MGWNLTDADSTAIVSPSDNGRILVHDPDVASPKDRRWSLPNLLAWFKTKRAENVVTVTGNSTFAAGVGTVNVNTGTATITLPAATGTGRRVTVRKISASAGTITIARAGSDTIEGATSETLKAQWGTAIFEDVASGSWAIVELHEEGSWTPVVNPQNGTGTTTITITDANYIKTGGKYSLQAVLTVDSVDGTGSGRIDITGAPFNFAKNSNANVSISGTSTINSQDFVGRLVAALNSISIYRSDFQTVTSTNDAYGELIDGSIIQLSATVII